MKGVILAGGYGTRLMPLTKVTNKHLLPIYNKPMIYYPLERLIDAGITDILIISGQEHAGHFLSLLGSGRDFNVNFTYEIQEGAGGIAQALALAENFSQEDSIMVILGDNVLENNLKKSVSTFSGGAKVFLKEVKDPHRFGVAEIKGENIVGIEEKPKNPKSNLAVTGLYIYDNTVFEKIKTIKPSGRGELEITDVNNLYIKKNKMKYSILKGFWSDAGTFDSLMKTSIYLYKKTEK